MMLQSKKNDQYQIASDSLKVLCIEFSKFNPEKANMHDLLTAWISFLKNPKSMRKTFLKIDEINLAMNRLQHISNSDMRK